MTGKTNVSAVMLTLNEADGIVDTLDSMERCFDELILVDGDSDDETVPLAEEWCAENGKAFDVLESNEREYLLEGPGQQRRRGEELASNDYTLAMGADVTVNLRDPEWFEQEFKHDVYSHTRERKGGHIDEDFRLYNTNPQHLPEDVDSVPRWRGMIHEEIQTMGGVHVREVFQCEEIPMTVKHHRHGAMEVGSVYPYHLHGHRPESGGNTEKRLKKQHYLLRQAMGSEQQKMYIREHWNDYFGDNFNTVHRHWREIVDEYSLPKICHDTELGEPDKTHIEKHWRIDNPEPIMGHNPDNFLAYVKSKLSNHVRMEERRY